MSRSDLLILQPLDHRIGHRLEPVSRENVIAPGDLNVVLRLESSGEDFPPLGHGDQVVGLSVNHQPGDLDLSLRGAGLRLINLFAGAESLS